MNEEIVFKNIAKHITLDEGEKSYFASLLHYKKLKKGELLLKCGEVCRNTYFVISGCLRNYTIDEYGREHVMAFAQTDWWTADLYSYLTETPSEHIIDALLSTEVFAIRREDMENVFTTVPKFERFFRILYQNSMVSQMHRIKQIMSIPAEERYQYFIKRYPDIYSQIPLKYIASYLGISPEFLSKVRNKIAHSPIS